MPTQSQPGDPKDSASSPQRPASSGIDLETLSYAGMVACGRAVRTLAETARSSEEVANLIAEYFYNTFRIPNSGERACVLVRCFQTHPLSGLRGHRRAFAESQLGAEASPDTRCLTLMATRGVDPSWNSVETSAGHAAIPLASAEVIRRAPMIARLLLQMGVPMEHILRPVNRSPDSEANTLRFDEMSGNFDVFHVERARGSNYIPGQEAFVKPFGVRSVVGMGGLLPDGEIFVVILFSRVRISREVAGIFRTMALNVKLALLPFTSDEIFEKAA